MKKQLASPGNNSPSISAITRFSRLPGTALATLQEPLPIQPAWRSRLGFTKPPGIDHLHGVPRQPPSSPAEQADASAG